MEDLFKTIKNLLFTYSSIVLVIIFAVMQSDHSKYDRALGSIRELQLLASDFDTQLVANLVNKQIPNINQRENHTVYISPLGINVKFIYNTADIDFSQVDEKLMGKLGGFNFGVGNIEKFPDDFTQYQRLNSIAPPLLKPDTLGRYQDIHNAALNGSQYQKLAPQFGSEIRLELFRHARNSYNSSERISISSISDGLVVDPVKAMAAQDSSATRDCHLSAAKTQINERYIYVCNSGKITYQGQSYDGVRIFLAAQSAMVPLSRDTLVETIGIPKQRQLKFDIAHKALSELASPYAYLSFNDLDKVLSTEKARTPTTISIVGAQINIELLTQLAFGALAFFFIYILLHIRESTRLVSNGAQPALNTWVATYAGTENLCVVAVQLFVLPVLMLSVLIVKDIFASALIIGLSFTAQFIAATFLFYAILHLRKVLRSSFTEQNPPLHKYPAEPQPGS